MQTRTDTISGPQVDNPESQGDDDDDDEAPRKYQRLPLYLETAEIETSALVNPEETDRAKMKLARIPTNFIAETHRLRRADFQDDTFFLEHKADQKEQQARALLAEVETSRANIAKLRLLPLDQRELVSAFQKGQQRMAKLLAQARALGLDL